MAKAAFVAANRASTGGRPKLRPEERRVHEVRTFMNPSELAKLEHDAQTCGMNVQRYIRTLVLGHKPQHAVELKTDPHLLLALNSIGNLLNQIARYCHVGSPRWTQIDHALTLVSEALSKAAKPGDESNVH